MLCENEIREALHYYKNICTRNWDLSYLTIQHKLWVITRATWEMIGVLFWTFILWLEGD